MAPSVEPSVIEIFPWPHFASYRDTMPVVGGKLYSFAPNSSVPKTLYADPYLLVPYGAYVELDEHGEANVYMDGHYDLRLFDAEGVLLWQVSNYTFEVSVPAPTGGTVSGFTDATVSAANGQGVISVSGLVPTGCRVIAVIARIEVDFGTSNGLSQILIGDSTANDRFGSIGLTAGLTTGQQSLHAGDEPIAATPYVVLLAAIGGYYDAVGTIAIRAFWENITGWS